MSKTLNVAVIGTGGISNTHMPGWADSPHAQVVAGSDVNEAFLADWGKKHDVTKLETDPGAVSMTRTSTSSTSARRTCTTPRWRLPR